MDGLYVRNLAPSRSVLERGLALQGYCQDCFGSVRIEDCNTRQMPLSFGPLGPIGVYRCDDVVLARCTTEVMPFSKTSGGAMVYGLESTITIHETMLEGLDGEHASKPFAFAGDGADGVEVLRCTLVLAGCELIGGDEGNGGGAGGGAGPGSPATWVVVP